MKKIAIFCFVLCALSTTFISCKDEDPVSEFSLPEEELFFNAEGGTQKITLSANADWSVTSDVEWCLVSPTNGKAGTVCEVRVDTSYLYSQREAHLNFHCGSKTRQVRISQLGYEKVILLDVKSINVPDFPEDDNLWEDIKVQTNVPFETHIEYASGSEVGWLSSKIMQTGKVESVPREGKVRISYQMYLDSDKDREATVVLRQSNAKPGETPVEVRLPFRQTKAQKIIPSREGDSLALLTLVRIMHLSTSWDYSQNMYFWNNVTMEDRTYFNEKLQKTVTEPRVIGVHFTMLNTNEGIPYHIRYLDQLEEVSFIANSNAHLKNIDLGEHITYLPKLKYLNLLGYGISRLPERMKKMEYLEELELSGNNFTKIPVDLIKELDKKNLKYINLANNRRRDVFGNLFAYRNVRDTLGIHGELPMELLELKNIRYIGLSYNYLEGELPGKDLYDASQYATLEEKVANNPVLPKLEQLSINLNFFSGAMPDWLLYHPNLRCWDPYTLVFNQYERSRDSNNRNTGFTNEPASVEQVCHLWDNVDDNLVFSRQNTFDAKVKYHTLNGIIER